MTYVFILINAGHEYHEVSSLRPRNFVLAIEVRVTPLLETDRVGAFYCRLRIYEMSVIDSVHRRLSERGCNLLGARI